MNAHQAGRRPEEYLLKELIHRLSEEPGVVRIILFGSAAEGRMNPDSDLDLLVVVKDGMHRRRTAQALYRKLSGFPLAKDIIVVTESDVTRYKDNFSLVIYPALKTGEEIYRAAR